jgi:hypothetical protein
VAPTDPAFVDALLEAPAGVSLLACAEGAQREWVPPWDSPRDSDPEAVQRAVEAVSVMPFGEILSWAVSAAENLAGPWSGSSLEELPWCYRLASERRSIAVAISERFGQRLHESADHEGQQWWECPQAEGYVAKPLFGDFSHVYGNGEFPWEGLWTVTDPPPEVHDSLISAWDYLSGTTSRWRLPVRTDARVWNINGPADWVRLVETSPKVATAPHSGWELPGPNQHHRDIEELLSTPNQCAVRVDIERHVLPDWDAVARDYDGARRWGDDAPVLGQRTDAVAERRLRGANSARCAQPLGYVLRHRRS